MKLSFYTPIAYDYLLSFAAISSYYDIADEIILAIDKDRMSWNKNKYEFNDTLFYDEIKKIDTSNKIKILEENFHEYSDLPIENDTNERNIISSNCKAENYIIGIDSDEILLNAKIFYDWLTDIKTTNFDTSCVWHSVYKIIDSALILTLPEEIAHIGTNLRNKYSKCRITTNENVVLSSLKILHFSWGRQRKDVIEKLYNWSHSKDFNLEKNMRNWDNVTLENFKSFHHIHPLKLKQWWVSLEIGFLEDYNISQQTKNYLLNYINKK